MPLECFIAMAFGKADTDAVYNRAIAPILRRRGVRPFRVDRSVRNEDIDDQILAGLHRCDLVIADLTYARPSVYFEAGVAHGRRVPVIFTSRSDHLRQRPDDLHGNFRIHFDLQMKPIITWRTIEDSRFSRRLNSRLRHVIRPLLKRKQATVLDERRAAAFALLPLQEKLNQLQKVYLAARKRHGYLEAAKHGGASMVSPRSGHLKWCDARFCNTLSKNDLVAYGRSWVHRGLEGLLQESFEVGRLPRRASRHVILCSLQRVPVSRVAASFPQSSVHTDNGLVLARHQSAIDVKKYATTRQGLTDWSKKRTASVPTDVTIAVISGLRHPNQLEVALKKIFA